MNTEDKMTGLLELSEEVSYLRGRVDTLEKLILSKESYYEEVVPEEETESLQLQNMKRYEEMLRQEKERVEKIKEAFSQQFKPLNRQCENKKTPDKIPGKKSS